MVMMILGFLVAVSAIVSMVATGRVE